MVIAGDRTRDRPFRMMCLPPCAPANGQSGRGDGQHGRAGWRETNGRKKDRAPERRRSPGQGRGGPHADASVGPFGVEPAADRPDPVALLAEQDVTREPDLVPVRHGRMMVSPFTFYRGAAAVMAADLKDTPVAGPGRPAVRRCAPVELRPVRLARAAAAVRPERLRRDAARAVRVRREADGGELHDRGPQQRVLPGRHPRRALASATAYREAMAEFAQMPTMEIWYAHLDEDELMRAIRHTVAGTKKGTKGRSREGRSPRRPGRNPSRKRSWPSWPRSGRRRPARRRTRGTACRRCPSSASWSTGPTGSSASRRSSSRHGTWPPPTACHRTRSCR